MDLNFEVEAGQPILLNAAGTVKTTDQALAMLHVPAPGLVIGSYTLEERSGNQGTTFFGSELASLNSLGLPSPAISTWCNWIRELVGPLHDVRKKLIVSIAGFGTDEFRQMTNSAFEAGADAVELNLGCPNVWDEGEQKRIFSFAEDQVGEVLTAVRGIGSLPGPIGVKLSPLFDAVLLNAIDRLILESRLDFLTTTNTVPNCFAFNELNGQAITFGSGLAGMSGPAVKWIGLGQVLMHRSNLPEIFIFGVGGIERGNDVKDYERAGANGCQIATAYWNRGPRAVLEILQQYLESE